MASYPCIWDSTLNTYELLSVKVHLDCRRSKYGANILNINKEIIFTYTDRIVKDHWVDLLKLQSIKPGAAAW